MGAPFSAWVLASRPKTLTAGAIPVIAASALAFRVTGSTTLWIFLCAIFSALLIQIGTNFVNDAWDHKRGADTDERLGPTRATHAKLIDAHTMLRRAAVVLGFALILGIPLVAHGGAPILLIGLTSIFFAWGYTAGPYPLAYNGLGEIFVLIFFGLIAVGGMYYLYTLEFSYYAALLGMQLGILSMLIIAINNLRDINQDRVANKKTIAVRFGERIARLFILLCCITPYLLCYLWFSLSKAAAIAPLCSFPLALHIGIKLQTLEPSRVFNQFLGKAALLHALFGLLISGAFIWG